MTKLDGGRPWTMPLDTLKAEASDATEALHDAALGLAERYGEAAAARLLRQMADEIEPAREAGD